MTGQGILFALVTTVFWSVCIFPFTIAARKLGVNPLNHLRLLVATTAIGLSAIIFDRNNFTNIFSLNYSEPWIWLGLSGIIGLTVGDYFAFSMYRILGPRTGSVLTTFAPAAALILGAMLIDERISVTGIIGIFITIAGVNVLIFGKSEREQFPDHGHGSIGYGIFCGILSALCQGAGLVLAKKGMNSFASGERIPPLEATFMRLSVAGLSLFIFTLITGQIKFVLLPILSNKEKGIKYALAGTLFGPVLGVCFSLYSVSRLDASVAQTIFSLVPAFAFLIAAIFYKEKLNIKGIAGLVIALSGVIILIWRNEITKLF